MSSTDWEPRVRRLTDNLEERLVYAASLVRDQHLDAAYAELSKILDRNEYCYPATLLLGLVYQGMKRTEEANDCYLKALKLDPMQSQPAMLAGFATSLLGDRDEAVRLFKAALHLEPAMAAAHLGLARLLRRPEELETALFHAQSALRAEPQLGPARVVLAGIYRRMGDLANAIDQLETLLATQAAQPATVVLLAGLYTDTNQPAKALALLEFGSRRWPDQASVWSRLGHQRLRAGDPAGAEQAFREFVRLRPKDKAAPLRLVDALIPQAKYEEALRLLNDIPRYSRIAAIVQKSYGDIYLAQHRYAEALEHYRAAARLGSDGPAAIAAIESASAGGPPALLAKKYQQAIQKVIDERRERLVSGDLAAAGPAGGVAADGQAILPIEGDRP